MSRDLIERLQHCIVSEAPGSWRKETMREAADRIAALEAEALETARLLGMGGEREANLHGEVTRLKKALARAEAEASEGERRGLERALEFANFEAEAWGYADGSSVRAQFGWTERDFEVAVNVAKGIADTIRALIPEAPAREGE